MNPYKETEESSFDTPHLSYEDIATKLLKDNFFLTALELHTELVESGKELPQLREFFSNPGNFEQHVSRASELNSIHRTPSQATLDSLDTARYSEDGGGDRGGSGGDVAVLEFELRKARETINSLRANLTQFADGSSTLDKSSQKICDQRSLKPHEKRALNFLINEYLLMQDYKLTSITFSDENPDQEFEDWDDVGLNMPRPAGIVSLFRGESVLSVPKVDSSTETNWQQIDAGCQTELDERSICVSCQDSIDHDNDWAAELLIQAEEIEMLKQKAMALEMEKQNFQKLYDTAIVSLNSLASPAIESKALDLNTKDEKMIEAEQAIDTTPITCTASENHYGSGNSTHSATPEQFEMIESEKNSTITRKEGSTLSSFEHTVLGENCNRDSPLRRGSVTTLDEALSINDGGEWTRVQYEYNSIETSSKEMWIDSGLPNSLKVSILNWCCETLNLNESFSNDLLVELINNDKPITLPGFLTLAADTMPRIIPHTLVARRFEAAALLAASVALLPTGDPRRARTLHSLLTLVKKPEPSDTRSICEAACYIVKWGGSGEVLSSVAELLASRSAERRILASQICVAIAPYVPIELCTSLLLSLVVLMCESNEIEIRSLALKSACLICPVAEHKYAQLENIMFGFLKDPIEKHVKDTVSIFGPILARSALMAGKFCTDLCTRIMRNAAKESSDNEWKNAALYLDLMKSLVLAKLAYVINVQIIKDATSSDCDMENIILQEVPLEEQEHFVDLQCFVSDVDAKTLLAAANRLVKEKPDVRWPELNWFIDFVKQVLDLATTSKVLSHQTMYEKFISLFSSYVENFGVSFTTHILNPIFVDIIMDLEQKMEKLHTVNVESSVVVGIYSVTVLPAIGNYSQHGEFLQKWVMYCSLRSFPPKVLSIPMKWVCEHRPDTLDFYLQHLREFAASSCESASGSSVRVYISNIITELLNTTEINEKCIERQVLPAVVALLHDDDVSVREVALTSWGSMTRTCLIRGLACEAQCWAAADDLLCGTHVLSTKEGLRAAEALTLLVLPTADSHAVSEKAVSLLCALCERGPACAERVAALTPGLQLAVHHCGRHPAILPALRKLEEEVQSPALSQHRAAVESLVQTAAGAPAEPARDPPRPANLLAAQEVGRRVTQMFHQSKTNINLQNIFKKKP
ncbi:RAB11-binding protein RELCH [Bombyx mori]|uniref:Uncharacterized protein n=1 Tax=Bombyx mori TaxID=7091 RepID=A0A8R2LZF9_BOMMO|nr:RAB11-binding protein RELCH [Bombyx mori]